MRGKVESNEQAIMDYLHEHVFNPILSSPRASKRLKAGVKLTTTRMRQLSAPKMVEYYWNAIKGTERSKGFAALMRKKGSFHLKRQSTSLESALIRSF
jgi:hypothetical protein